MQVSGSGRRQELLRVDDQMRLVRLLVIPFAFAQFLLYRAPEGVVVPFDPLVMALLVSSVVLVTNIASMASVRIESVRLLTFCGIAQLTVDAALAVGVVWLFAFDTTSALWALLIIPVLEGAIRARLPGALITWAGCGLGYIAREIVAPSFVDTAEFHIESVTYRLGIILVVAAATGYLARNLEGRIVDNNAARRESDRRAELLHIVASGGRAMSSLEPNEVLRAVVDSCVKARFEGAGIAIIDHEAGTFGFAEYMGLPSELASLQRPADEGIVGRVRSSRAPVAVDDSDAWEGRLTEAKALGYRSVVACPIWERDEIDAVLIVGTRERGTVSPHELEFLELLASHAGAAFSTARHFIERQHLQEKLEHESFFDSLTGLPNRTLFLDRLVHCLERKESMPSPAAVLMVDLDRFKKVNESLGHEVGDEVIRLVSERLQTSRAPGDTIARYGDDDFAVLIEDPESESEVLDHAARIVDELQRPFEVDGRAVYISASVGVSFGQQFSGVRRDLLREADVAMYRAKERGGARCEVYRPVMTALARRRMELEIDLRSAIDDGQLLVHYQPAISVQTGNVVGLEALVRWRHHKRGLVSAADFVPLAEESGLVVPLGHYVLERVTKQMSKWRKDGFPTFPVAVNVSATEFGQPDFVDRVVRTIEANGIDPAQLLLEVTETVVMRDDRVTGQQMRKLEETGIRLAIDDFGLGYSALSYLKRFKFSVLKIDRSFITDVATRETDQAIVRYVLALAGDLGIPVVAEGVETAEQLDYLRTISCAYVQGFHLCRPLDAADLAAFVAANHHQNGPNDYNVRGSVAAGASHEPV
jgi:diguanylate cyclase (GGDEF)-like protein